jgi:hypothetical protein
MSDMMAQLAASLNGHQVTDEEGNITEESETPVLESAQEEQTTEEETAPAEKPQSQEPEVANAPEPEDQETLAEDESGKKYVPESRFKTVYGKMKATERELKEMKAQLAQGEALLQTKSLQPGKQPEKKVDKADILELKLTLPQFNPHSVEYNETLDMQAFRILRDNPQYTPMQAAQQAMEEAKALTQQVSQAKTEARSVKVQQSDSGITNRVVSRAGSQPDFDSMSDKEMEAWLKTNGQW